MTLQIRIATIFFGLLTWVDGSTRADESFDFAHDVVPVLKKHCVECHGADKSKGGFSLNTRELFLDAEAAIPGKAAKSRVIELVTSHDPQEQMPPKGKQRLSSEEIAVLRRWINSGLEWEADFSFAQDRYEPPLKPRNVELPPAVDGRTNPVDRLVDRYFASRKIEFPGEVSDAQFMRRLSLDLVGLLPTEEELAQFVAPPSEEPAIKRAGLIESLLADDIAYADHWLSFWNDLLRNDYTGTGFITRGRKQITAWLYRSLRENKPYDQFVRELLVPTAESEGFIQGIKWRGNVNSSQSLEVQFAQNISQAFLGINMKCASCHDSFINDWKLADAYGLAAIYSTRELEIHRCDKPTGKTARATWIFPELGKIDPNADQKTRLTQLADLMTHRDNGRFTRTIVNRIWHRLMGRGIVHPVDAMETRPWNEDLLDYLAEHLVQHKYNLKATLRLICSSKIYQAKVASNHRSLEGSVFVFHGPLAKKLTAEQFVDAVWQLTKTSPTKQDAKIDRISKANVDKPASAITTKLTGQWIWSYPEAGGGKPAAGETITVRKTFQLDDPPETAIAAISCDNEFKLYVNNRRIAASKSWSDVSLVDLKPALRKGNNTIIIVCKNAGNAPNPAGLFFESHIKVNKQTEVLGSDSSWSWTSATPNNKGSFGDVKIEWKNAAVVLNPPWPAQVQGQTLAKINRGAPSAARTIRASLVKNTPLMKALGRPNRDQIVSMRPSQFTTLEAIDLANGQELADAIKAGGDRWASHANFADSRQLTHSLFQQALCRSPTPQESKLAVSILGKRPTSESIQDLLWAILMLPEFQLVR